MIVSRHSVACPYISPGCWNDVESQESRDKGRPFSFHNFPRLGHIRQITLELVVQKIKIPFLGISFFKPSKPKKLMYEASDNAHKVYCSFFNITNIYTTLQSPFPYQDKYRSMKLQVSDEILLRLIQQNLQPLPKFAYIILLHR
jgi:hypothetical protein